MDHGDISCQMAMYLSLLFYLPQVFPTLSSYQRQELLHPGNGIYSHSISCNYPQRNSIISYHNRIVEKLHSSNLFSSIVFTHAASQIQHSFITESSSVYFNGM